MLRINLLPPYIFDKQKKVQLAIVWGVVAAAAIALFVIWSSGVAGRLDEEKKKLADATDAKTQYDNVESQITDVNNKVAVTKSKQTFIADAKKSNDSWPAVYEQMRDVTSPLILLESLAIDPGNHKALDFAGFAKDELTIARWWMTLRNAKDRFDSVSFNLPTHPYVPANAQGGAGGFGQMGRFGGPMGGGRGFGGGSGMPPGMMSGSMPPGMSGGSGMPPMAMAGRPGMMTPGGSGMGGFGGSGMGGFRGGMGGGNNANVGPAEIEGRPGLNFTGVAMVKDTLAPPMAPTWPAGGGRGGAVGMGGMMGGGMPAMMGGGRMSGMPPGMMGGSMPAAPAPAAGGDAPTGLGKRGKAGGGDD
jgi:hypothetical protein